jgi:hypothetical protein
MIVSGVLALGCAVTNILYEMPDRFEHYFISLTSSAFAVFLMSLSKLAETREKTS